MNKEGDDDEMKMREERETREKREKKREEEERKRKTHETRPELTGETYIPYKTRNKQKPQTNPDQRHQSLHINTESIGLDLKQA